MHECNYSSSERLQLHRATLGARATKLRIFTECAYLRLRGRKEGVIFTKTEKVGGNNTKQNSTVAGSIEAHMQPAGKD